MHQHMEISTSLNGVSEKAHRRSIVNAIDIITSNTLNTFQLFPASQLAACGYNTAIVAN